MSSNTYDTVEIRPKPLQETIESEPCYFGTISREEAETNLLERGENDGTFLVRKGTDGEYRISLLSSTSDGSCRVYNYRVKLATNRTYSIDDTYSFPAVHQLVRYYSQKCSGLPSKLVAPCPKEDLEKEPESGFHPLLPVIAGSSVEMRSQLSCGSYSEIWKANYLRTTFAAKCALSNHCTLLVKEANIMRELRHNNVVQISGVILEPQTIVFDYYPNRDLLDYMLRGEKYEMTNYHRTQMAIQVASGLEYISKRGIIHRNIRASNILVDQNLGCKVSSFGYAVNMDKDGRYIKDEGELTQNILRKVSSGVRVGKPPIASQEMYDIMKLCWHPNYDQRPDFNKIQTLLKLLTDKKVTIKPKAIKAAKRNKYNVNLSSPLRSKSTS
uniref:tyrosine-protein kinase Lck-like isoform X2 n=1 Tax=Ciona intestinalis TaxID=7719 RepID=UPI000EF4DD41|nr:tyrosine-protein kinase Lck-like isoform X2 [Ciona intestinalis]|eukprot:XP_026692447.1 tyrosine-protein kinase Lck-like isoform X2 [Ciona intestinalis]